VILGQAFPVYTGTATWIPENLPADFRENFRSFLRTLDILKVEQLKLHTCFYTNPQQFAETTGPLIKQLMELSASAIAAKTKSDQAKKDGGHLSAAYYGVVAYLEKGKLDEVIAKLKTSPCGPEFFAMRMVGVEFSTVLKKTFSIAYRISVKGHAMGQDTQLVLTDIHTGRKLFDGTIRDLNQTVVGLNGEKIEFKELVADGETDSRLVRGVYRISSVNNSQAVMKVLYEIPRVSAIPLPVERKFEMYVDGRKFRAGMNNFVGFLGM
jgi:hypothetical protein